jgi:hypothetical protein
MTALLLCAAAACGAKDDDVEQTACDARADRLATRLSALAKEAPSWMYVPPGLTPIESPRGAAMERPEPTVVVRRDGALEYRGEPTPDLGERLAIERRIHPDASAVYVLADRDAPAAAVGQVVAALPAGMSARLVVRGPERPIDDADRRLRRQPSVAEFAAGIDRKDVSERAVHAAEAMSKAIGRCTPMIELFGAVAGVDPEGKTRIVAEGAPRALRACGCRLADVELFEYVLLSIFDAYGAPMRWLPLADVPADARTAAELAR